MELFRWLAHGLHQRIDRFRTRELAALEQHHAAGTSGSTLAHFAELHVAGANLLDAMIKGAGSRERRWHH